jgi:hypothetical protein
MNELYENIRERRTGPDLVKVYSNKIHIITEMFINDLFLNSIPFEDFIKDDLDVKS